MLVTDSDWDKELCRLCSDGPGKPPTGVYEPASLRGDTSPCDGDLGAARYGPGERLNGDIEP